MSAKRSGFDLDAHVLRESVDRADLRQRFDHYCIASQDSTGPGVIPRHFFEGTEGVRACARRMVVLASICMSCACKHNTRIDLAFMSADSLWPRESCDIVLIKIGCVRQQAYVARLTVSGMDSQTRFRLPFVSILLGSQDSTRDNEANELLFIPSPCVREWAKRGRESFTATPDHHSPTTDLR